MGTRAGYITWSQVSARSGFRDGDGIGKDLKDQGKKTLDLLELSRWPGVRAGGERRDGLGEGTALLSSHQGSRRCVLRVPVAVKLLMGLTFVTSVFLHLRACLMASIVSYLWLFSCFKGY